MISENWIKKTSPLSKESRYAIPALDKEEKKSYRPLHYNYIATFI